MTVHLYVLPESFSNNNSFSLEDLEQKTFQLSDDVSLINKYKEDNKIYVNYSELVSCEFYRNISVEKILSNVSEAKDILGRDLTNAFIKIFQKVEDTSFDSASVKDLLSLNDATLYHGILAFNQIEGINLSSQIIYNINNWYKLRRNLLCIYPIDSGFFLKECGKYFPNIYLHERNKDTIPVLFPDFVFSIIKHLSCLNDVFYYYKDRKFDNETVKYKTFTAECHLDEAAAAKDNNSAKDALTFGFEDKKRSLQQVVCYPHLRLSNSDKAGDSKYYFYRIYFHEGIENIQNGRILIGHVGDHL